MKDPPCFSWENIHFKSIGGSFQFVMSQITRGAESPYHGMYKAIRSHWAPTRIGEVTYRSKLGTPYFFRWLISMDWFMGKNTGKPHI